MRGWSSLKNYFQKLWRAEVEATKDAVEGLGDSHISAARSRSFADWASKYREANAATLDAEMRRRTEAAIVDALTAKRKQDEEDREYAAAWESDLTGRLSPLPSGDSYGGGVPQRPVQGESALWITSGKFKTVTGSDNVYAIAYDIRRSSLFVQYKHWAPPMPLGTQAGPGPVYEYKNVSIAEAHALFKATNVSQWLWDYVRVRGTWGGHRKPYRLVAMSGGYLPRKATMSNDGREWFIRRFMTSAGGGSVVSQLPDRPAPPMGFDGKPQWNYWRPYRATPNRARPNNGRKGDSPNVPY